MDEWASYLQFAFTFKGSNYRRNNTQHREYAVNRNRRHTNLQHNLQFSAHLCVLQTILSVKRTASNHLLHLKTLDLAKQRLSTVKERQQRSKDILFRVTQNESVSEDIKYVQRTQADEARSKLVNFNTNLDHQVTH